MQAIFTADDFGRSSTINAAVIRAHQDGVLTSASLMVTGDAFEEAVELALRHPTLAVGLHLVTGAGRAALSAHRIPHLAGPDGYFLGNPASLGLRCFFNRAAQMELAAEIEAQLQRFAQTGLPLDHVNGHYHMHLHPTVLRSLVPLAQRYGARGFRLPRDRLVPSLAWSRQRAGTKIVWAAIYALLNRAALRAWQPFPFVITDRVYGFMQSGCMEEGYVVRMLEMPGPASAEFYFHPDTASPSEPFGPNPGDLATLLSPRVRQTLEERGHMLTTYSALSR